MNNITYKTEREFKKRYDESMTIRNKYPEKIPIICERSGNNIQPLDKKKFLAPSSISLGEFIVIIRKRLKLKKEQAMFCFINNKLPIISRNLATIYNENKDDDGFLYILYSGENCFGCNCFDIRRFRKHNFLLAINRLSSLKLFEKKSKKYDISKPDISKHDPDISKPDPDIYEPDPDISKPEPDIYEPDPDIYEPDPDISLNNIVIIKSNIQLGDTCENDNISITSDYSDYDVI